MNLTSAEEKILKEAFNILDSKIKSGGEPLLTSPQLVKNYLRLALESKEHECFVVIFLDTQHRVIELREMFTGTINACTVYPRAVVKTALDLGAGAIILAHNHPSQDLTPSIADRKLTNRLVEAMEIFDVNVLDHFIIGGGSYTSFAELGYL